MTKKSEGVTYVNAGAGSQGTPAAAEVPEPPSPCVSVCALDENDVCLGCYRTSEEITDWFMASPTAKREILARAEIRRSEAHSVRLG